MSQPSKHSSLAPLRSLAGPNWVTLGLRNWGSGERGRRDEETQSGLRRNWSSSYPRILKFVLEREIYLQGKLSCSARTAPYSANIYVLLVTGWLIKEA